MTETTRGGIPPLDLKASNSCMLSLLDAATPTDRNLEPRELDQYVTHVVLPGSATVYVDGRGIVIPEGAHRWARSTSMTYSLTPPEPDELGRAMEDQQDALRYADAERLMLDALGSYVTFRRWWLLWIWARWDRAAAGMPPRPAAEGFAFTRDEAVRKARSAPD